GGQAPYQPSRRGRVRHLAAGPSQGAAWKARRRGRRERDRRRGRPRRRRGFAGQGAAESLPVRGIRGATTAAANTAEAINEATEELLRELMRVNDLDPSDVACAFFTTTTDLDAEFPAHAARGLGWTQVALLCGHDMNVRQPN